MGISGLLPFLEKISKKCHISEFKGSVVAVDAYCWLHKGAFSCSEKLVRGEDVDYHISYCMKYVNLLLNFNLTPILVFDGQHLEAKKEIELKRREDKKFAKQKALELVAIGRAHEARQYFSRCVDISHEMALKLIKACHKINVDCIVAPFEADAQLAFLNMNGIVDLVITEDSDLLPFGCKKTLFKLNIDGSCTLIDQDKLCVAMQTSPDVYSFDKFRYMCILSGCDYLKSLPGIGIKKAHKAFRFTHNNDITSILNRLGSYLNVNITVSQEYIKNFMIADATFRHQIVYNPLTLRLQYLTDPTSCGTKEEYLCKAGSFVDEKLAFQMAIGNIDPISKKVLDSWAPNQEDCKFDSIWSSSFKVKTTVPKQINKDSFIKSIKKTTPSKTSILDFGFNKINYDKELEQELNVYKTPCKKRKLEENDCKEEKDEDITTNNPFVKKKKLSKFSPTISNKATVVKSRFFSARSEKEVSEGRQSPSLIYKANSDESMSVDSVESMSVDPVNLNSFTKNKIFERFTSDEKKSSPVEEDIEKTSPIINLNLFQRTAKVKLKVNEIDIENLTPPESSDTYDVEEESCQLISGLASNSSEDLLNSQESLCENLSLMKTSSLPSSQVLEEKNHTVNLSNSLLTSKPVLQRSISESKWIQKSRRVGLSKNKSVIKQPTLLTMFKKMGPQN